MFGFRKTRESGLTLMLGLAALIVVGVSGYAVVSLIASGSKAQDDSVNIYEALVGEQDGQTGQAVTPVSVKRKYLSALQTLRGDLSAYNGSFDSALDVASDSLLSMRVPKESLDPHLFAVLEIRRMRGDAGAAQDSANESVQPLIDIIDELIRSVS